MTRTDHFAVLFASVAAAEADHALYMFREGLRRAKRDGLPVTKESLEYGRYALERFAIAIEEATP